VADDETVTSRLSGRKRINIAGAEDIFIFNTYVDEWLATIPSHHVLQLDVSRETLDYEESTNIVLDTIKKNLYRRST
jgi:hypothetical protein